MTSYRTTLAGAAIVAAATLMAAGCGSSSGSGSTAAQTGAGATTSAGSSSGSTTPQVLAPDAGTAGTGDIPDNQVFLTFHSHPGFSMRYPEGWAQRGTGSDVLFQDKNNLVHVTIRTGPPPTPASVTAELAASSARMILVATPAVPVIINGHPAVKVTYRTVSAPNPVTGKQVTLIVDRYELGQAGKVATVDLGVPTGVDNRDAYLMMIESFRWS